MDEAARITKRSCSFCQHPDRDGLEDDLLAGNTTPKVMDQEMGWRANTADRQRGMSPLEIQNDETKTKNITFIKTKSSKETYSRICCNFFDNPSSKLNLVGTTGTNGKTTCSTLLYQMFLSLIHI